MILTLYDENFNALLDNSSLVIERGSMKLINRAYDLNSFSCMCEAVSIDIEPMFAIVKENTGEYKYGMLKPLMTRDIKNKSNVIAKDLFYIFDTDVLINMPLFYGTTLKSLFSFIFNAWKNFDDSGFENVTLDLNFNEQGSTFQNIYRPMEHKVYNVRELIGSLLAYYGLHIISEIRLATKELYFLIESSSQNIVNIRLEDFGINGFEKTDPAINTAIITSDRIGFDPKKWYLLKSGEITDNVELRDLFPTRTKAVHIEGKEMNTNEFLAAITKANFEAVTALAENRYQESIELNVARSPNRLNYIYIGSQRRNLFFETSFSIYYKGQPYKVLPIGEIEEDDIGNKVIRLGYKPLDFMQIINRNRLKFIN